LLVLKAGKWQVKDIFASVAISSLVSCIFLSYTELYSTAKTIWPWDTNPE
jgi:ABC-type thiamin/hydroxymethylpyrimidine transport system permease subunit